MSPGIRIRDNENDYLSSLLTPSFVMEPSTYSSPCGLLYLGVRQGCICLCDWNPRPGPYDDDPCLLTRLRSQLDAYFRGDLRTFTLTLLPAGTPFQQRVWEAVRQVPYGRTISYGQLAERMGYPTAVRAVARAVGANPVAILIPCHRIIGSRGQLTGYAGGLTAKRFLLSMEAMSNSRGTESFAAHPR